MRPLATITADTLDWYGFDEFGAGVYNVIGTRCDLYTSFLLNQTQYHHCYHSNLIRSLAQKTGLSKAEIEADVQMYSMSSCAQVFCKTLTSIL